MKPGYVPALDGLRGVAIICVIGLHALDFPANGGLGVDLFFVLSGFLITSLLLEERSRTGGVRLARFYWRRARRLVPALALLVGVYAAINAESLSELMRVVTGGAYLANVYVAYGEGMPDGLGHLWSLALEEQFYMLWPLTLLLLARRALIACLVAACAISMWAFGLTLHGEPWGRVAFAPDTRSAPLLVGCATALYLSSGRSVPRVTLGPALGVFAVFVLVLPFEETIPYGLPLLAFSVACAVLIALAVEPKGWLVSVLSFRPLLFTGRISYSLYLWHFPILVWLGTYGVRDYAADTIGIGLAVAAAVISYYAVEQPLRARHRSVLVEEVDSHLVAARPRHRLVALPNNVLNVGRNNT